VRLRLTGAVLLAALIAGACGDAGASPATPAPANTSAPNTTPGPAVASAAPVAPGSAAGSGGLAACTMPAGAAAPVLDASLMAILPSSVAGVAVTQEPSSFGEAVTDPCFAANVDRAVFPIAIAGSDLASGVVAHLRPGVYSDAFYSDWRATYDNGACAQSSGVIAEADETLGGRTIYVATCGGGLRVYHVYLADKGVIVSLLCTGSKVLGEQIMGQLRG
jgi:hypothetical protein